MGFHRELCRRPYALSRFLSYRGAAARAENQLDRFRRLGPPRGLSAAKEQDATTAPFSINGHTSYITTYKDEPLVPRNVAESMGRVIVDQMVSIAHGVHVPNFSGLTVEDKSTAAVVYPLFERARIVIAYKPANGLVPQTAK